MPYTVDEFGNKTYADIVMDPASLVSRLNVGRIYEHYFNDMSRRCRTLMRNSLNNKLNVNECSDDEVNKAYDILLGLLKIIGTEQYDAYLKEKDNMKVKRDIVNECVNKEVYILYTVSSKKKAWEIVEECKKTIYHPELKTVYMKTKDGIKTFKNKTRIAPIYEMLLNKTADEYLAVSGAKVNHFGIPINTGSAGKDQMPWRASAVKNISETEGRMLAAYGSLELTAELKDRANSIPTHKAIYKNILDAKIPTNIEDVVDRKQHPYGDDSALILVNNIFNAAGIKIDYTTDDK